MSFWTEDRDEVLFFGRILHEAGILDEAVIEVFYYFEKPEKWTPEHRIWYLHGKPGPDDHQWEAFVEEAQR
jgi:hypothetical protein